MTDNITLPRAVVEEVRSAIRGFYNKYSDEAVHEDAGRAIAALDAALAEPDAKPEPATDEQVAELCKVKGLIGKWSCLDYHYGWRDAERFHGIRKEDK
jgi:hypothetical protein